jgi:hypothetical protein
MSSSSKKKSKTRRLSQPDKHKHKSTVEITNSDRVTVAKRVFSAGQFRDEVIAALKAVNVPVKGDDDGRVRGIFDKGDRLANHGLGETTLNRDSAIGTAQKYFLNGNAGKDTPNRRGYAATWGAPGTGKTHLIDELVAWMATLPDTFVPIVANFNDNHSDFVYGVEGLLVRMLFSHVVGLAVPLVDGRSSFETAALALLALVQQGVMFTSD